MHDSAWLTFTDEAGSRLSYTFEQARCAVRTVADAIEPLTEDARACVVVDLPNCPLFLWTMLACAESGVPFVALNHRLTHDEKSLRLKQLAPALEPRLFIDSSWAKDSTSHPGKDNLAWSPANILKAADSDRIAVVMFTSGTTGTPKAAALTWGQLRASAVASNRSLDCDAASTWQAALPLYHIGGLQVALRSMLAGARLLLYARSDAERLLDDAMHEGCTHISVVDKMLQDLIAADTSRARPVLPTYRCILLGGAIPNRRTLAAACEADAHVVASYGMTETASQVANAPAGETFDGGLCLLDGVEARIVDPDGAGRGMLALRGPSIISRYLNEPAPLTDDGYFITGDTAQISGGALHVFERAGDMFVSGGENIYPAEIESCITQIEGVTDCLVIGIPDPTWGRRPAAIVESPLDPEIIANLVRSDTAERLARFSQPERIIVVTALPRTPLGKIDRQAARMLLVENLVDSTD